MNTLGFFGKLPSHGDFLRRDLPLSFTVPWDQWLQAGIAASQDQLREQNWLDCYLTAPLWRFCLRPGLCGKSAWVGVLLPSVDRVGRYFPLTAALGISEQQSLFQIAAQISWFQQLESLLLQALEETLPADALQDRLRDLGPPMLAPTHPIAYEPQESDTLILRFSKPEDAAMGPSLLAEELAFQRYGDFSFWWTGGSVQVWPNARLYRGLPPPDTFTTLLWTGSPFG